MTFTNNDWWRDAVFYQIYPRSFSDANGDGNGDLQGVIDRLDYLQALGVDALWLSPFYPSPLADGGYDVADYCDVDHRLGTLDQFDELVAKAHERGIGIIVDIVPNHTSDQHRWFQEALAQGPESEAAQRYVFRQGKGEHGELPPTNWLSNFGGSAWESCGDGWYYLHLFAKEQPDLNWENPQVRKAVYAMMNWWMDKGIDGFRMDVITQISKVVDKNGRLPGEAGSEIDDYPAGPEGYSSPYPFSSDGPRIDEFLQEMRREVFEKRGGYMNVGEAPGVDAARNEYITDPDHKELDMLFLFDHVGIDQGDSKWDIVKFDVRHLREQLKAQQEAVHDRGWASLFTCNHDPPRVVTRWGDDSNEENRVHSAKAFGMLIHLHRGTPYIYQGEELGMTGAHFTELSQYRDLESINAYRQRVEEAKVQSGESMMDSLALFGRDNARTPMQWDGSKYAGFTAADAKTEPWLSVNPNHVEINAAAQFDDPDSVYAFYKKLVNLRHNSAVVSAGEWALVDDDDEQVYAFTRTLTNADGTAERMLVAVNLTGRHAALPKPVADLLADGVSEDRIILSTYDAIHSAKSLANGELAGWEGVVVEL